MFDVEAKWLLFPKNLLSVNTPLPFSAPWKAVEAKVSAVPPASVNWVENVEAEPVWTLMLFPLRPVADEVNSITAPLAVAVTFVAWVLTSETRAVTVAVAEEPVAK